MPKKHYAGDVQQAIAAEIAQLRAQQNAAPVRAKSGAIAPQPGDKSAAFGGLGDTAAPGSASPQAEPDVVSRGAVSPPPPAPPASYGYAPAPAAPPPAPSRVYTPPPSPAPLPSTNIILTSLDQRINRLEQVRQWIGEDGEMARFLDTVIGQQVKSSERRQARLAVVLNIIFLIAGWALAYFLSPSNAFGRLLGL